MTEPDQLDERIAQQLARLGEDHEPPPGWQVRVLAAIAERPRRRWWWLVAPALVLAAILIYFGWFGHPQASPPERLAMEVRSERSEVKRGPDTLVSVGDTASATVRGGAFRALWIYRDDHLVLACPGDPRCRGAERQLDLAVTLEQLGRYRLVALASSRPIPPPFRSYDRAIAEARRAEIELDERTLDAR